jgi:hypothetical protein
MTPEEIAALPPDLRAATPRVYLAFGLAADLCERMGVRAIVPDPNQLAALILEEAARHPVTDTVSVKENP